MTLKTVDHIRTSEGEFFYRFTEDGLWGTGNANQFVTQLAVFNSNEVEKLTVVDDVFCGYNYDQAVGNVEMTVEINTYPKSTQVSAMGDNQTPTHSVSIPVGFNSGASAAEAAKMNMRPWAWCKSNEQLQVCLRRTNNTPIGNIGLKYPITVYLRKREVDVYA